MLFRSKFELLPEDDAADPKQGTAAAQKLVDAKVHGVVGHLNSGTTIPASRLYHDAGIPQITAWGTSYYCLGVLAKPIASDTGWSAGTVFFGFSVALLVMGFISTWVGRLIDRIGTRRPMFWGLGVLTLAMLVTGH